MIRKLTAALAVAGAVLLGLAAPASAEVQVSPFCQNGAGYQTRVDIANVVATNGVAVGTVELCRQGSLYFAFALFDQPMTASQYAQVYLNRYDRGEPVGRVDCDSPGGNKHIKPGERRCWTPNLNGAASRYTFIASVLQYSSHTGDLLSGGVTDETR
ncbi:hypothetical protein ACSHWB_41715 [Lentzea sp. HUAS TT2]|uniref:hypothetical protein n=1 Tax=Lentzea sp. HUAS TT2 TaxID=3447454 RepID=UPI003F70D015